MRAEGNPTLQCLIGETHPGGWTNFCVKNLTKPWSHLGVAGSCFI